MRILIDVCLSPQWVEFLQRGGVDAVHWTSVGSPCAKDRKIIAGLLT
jgi:predicted nuclease of predicted toxin-antitoxin system